MIVGGAIHPGFARVGLEPPFRVGDDDAVFFLRQRDNLCTKLSFALFALDFLGFRFGADLLSVFSALDQGVSRIRR